MAERGVGRAAIGAALFFVVAPGGVVGLAPYLISGWRREHLLPGALRAAAAVLMAIGVLSVMESFARFVLRGHGTPAPVAPPKHLVVSGQYRHVRNPMYVALVAIVVGQALWLGSSALAFYALVLLVLFHLRVVTYEEPQLVKVFGVEFATYRQAVPRWLPRVSPWKPSQATIAQESRTAEQGDEADEAGASDGASQLIPGVGRTSCRATERTVGWGCDGSTPAA